MSNLPIPQIILLLAIIVAIIIVKVQSYKTDIGQVNLTLKRGTSNKVLFAIILIAVVMYITSLIISIVGNEKISIKEILSSVFWILYLYLILFTQYSSNKITDKGVLLMGRFYVWEDIIQWKRSETGKIIYMKVKFNRKKATIGYPQLNIGAEHANKVNELFYKYKGTPVIDFK